MSSYFLKLFDEVDNRALVVFRIIFGFLLFAETGGAILTGWVRKTLVSPDFTFSFFDFPWLQPLPGDGMYYYFAIMAALGLCVMVGFYYRFSISVFTLMWSATYFMQKTHYNNHYYLLILLCLFMMIAPAHRYFSLDVRRDPSIKSTTCPRWCGLAFILQLWIVYTYAGIVKFYPGWLNGDFVRLSFQGKSDYWLIGEFLQKSWVQQSVVYGGIFYDLMIVPLLLIRRTRWVGVGLSVIFHLFNSFVFHIGIFPYLMLGMEIFFFPEEEVSRVFFRKRALANSTPAVQLNSLQRLLSGVLVVYFIFQVILPLRPYLIPGNVFWTEEGHRLSWRMMLRAKYGSLRYKVVHTETGKVDTIKPKDYLYRDQVHSMKTKPDMIWAFAQRLAKMYAERGEGPVEIYAISRVTLNGTERQVLIDPEVDLAKAEWHRFKRNEWILSYP